MSADYKEIKDFNSIYDNAIHQIISEEPEFIDDFCIIVDDFYVQNSLHLDILRKIDKFTLLPVNWDGYNALPLSKRVAEKSKEFIENLDMSFYSSDKDFEIKPTPYSTLVIDWYSGDSEFSLEIGNESLGYYVDGVLIKEADKIGISTKEELTKAIEVVSNDLMQIF